MRDLTNQLDVVAHMREAKNESDWNNRCDEVKKANLGQYPTFWFFAIVLSGVLKEVKDKW